MKEAFDMKNFLYGNQNFLPFFFFLAVCYMSSLIGQINKARATARLVFCTTSGQGLLNQLSDKYPRSLYMGIFPRRI